MNLHHLRVFHAAAQAGGITAGAARLNLSQPAASREIKELEIRLGVTLLDRSSRGLSLTEAGRDLLDYARRIFALEQAAEARLRDLAGLEGGRLLLGASNTIGNHLLPPLLARFAALYPGIEITLLVSNSQQVRQRLDDDQLNLGFVEGPAVGEDVNHRAIGHDRIIAVATIGHPLTLAGTLSATDLADRVAVAREPGSGTRASIDEAYAVLGQTYRPAITVGTAEALKNLLLAGGMAWVPRLSVLPELRSGRLVELAVADLVIERPLTMIWRKGRTLAPAARAFADLVCEDGQ
ncbi:LysR family transcriptional regulator [Magnetospirillum sulfuroxidans]|uniref:LysR family transcriptional regulator n=1 Tax=Magnetospirillum sulfuroxidans TaxID=611300 RepID=A0ABS5IG60_9PROT|nr:LysR family transcriptional regulator [Magnetospirillum sulfuroxidans]MBR9973424.1 LysR family transcriptional regulator [Magnetospirillum sulfuroxidans]